MIVCAAPMVSPAPWERPGNAAPHGQRGLDWSSAGMTMPCIVYTTLPASYSVSYRIIPYHITSYHGISSLNYQNDFSTAS